MKRKRQMPRWAKLVDAAECRKRPEPTPSVAGWIDERDARDTYLTAVKDFEGSGVQIIDPVG